METTAFITLDLQRLTYNRIRAKQNDTWRRRVNITVLSDGREINVAESSEFAVQYRKPDGTKGFYTHLPDGTVACTSLLNEIYMTMAPQMLTVAGEVSCSIAMLDQDHQVLQTFSFFVDVEESEGTGAESADYVNAPTLQNILNLVEVYSATLQFVVEENATLREKIEALETNASSYVKVVNGVRPNEEGIANIIGEDIPANPGNIPNVADGESVDNHLEALGDALFHCGHPVNFCFLASNEKSYAFDVDAEGKLILIEV